MPTLDDIRKALANMPSATTIEQRNRAVIAFAILSGARDGAIASFRLKHVDLDARTVFHDARDVKTKSRKTFKSVFFPVGPEPEQIFLVLCPDAEGRPRLPPGRPTVPVNGRRAERGGGISAARAHAEYVGDAEPIRRIFRDAFTAAGLPAFNPHSFRKTLALFADELDLSREEEKAWSQNFGHEQVRTTRESYGALSEHRQAALMQQLTEHRKPFERGDPIAQMRALVERIAREKVAYIKQPANQDATSPKSRALVDKNIHARLIRGSRQSPESDTPQAEEVAAHESEQDAWVTDSDSLRKGVRLDAP